MWPNLGSDEFCFRRQFHELWDESMRGGLPIIFNFMNNFYGMGGQTAEEPWHLITSPVWVPG